MQRRSNKPGLHALLAMMIAIFLASGQVLAQSRSGLPNAPQALPTQTQNHPATSAGALEGKDKTTTDTHLKEHRICGVTRLGRCLQNLGSDERGIFTSPFRLRARDAYWLMSLGAATGLAFAYDSEASNAVGVDKNRTKIANDISDFGSYYATGAESAGVYFLGLAQKNPKLAETGRLGAEAILAAGTVTMVLKGVTNRQRPLQGNHQGDFWADGASHWQFDSSFPSGHATASMALARVVAGEYPHWYVVLPAYGFAESVGISRILAKHHFSSDVLIGQAIGFLTGSYVLHHHARYCCGRWGRLSRNVMSSIAPIANLQSHALGVSMQIPFSR